MEPFWGPVTANVDWCEPNYSHTRYIAEFYNTLSSLPMVWFGLIGMIEARRMGLTGSPALSFFALMVVGIGSVLFHGTLHYSAQLADELPMILGALVFVYQMWDILKHRNVRLRKLWFPEWLTISLLIGYGVLTTLFMALWTHSPLPMNISYVLMVLFIIFSSIQMYRTAEQSLMKRTFEISLICYVFGCGCWLVEKHYCQGGMPVTQYLHAVWHLGAGFGTYAFLQWTTYLKAHALKYNPQLAFQGILPIVSLPSKEPLSPYNGPNTRSRSKKSV
jgi:dihydroceramidase